VLGAAAAPGYLRTRCQHSEVQSPQAEPPAKACGSLVPGLFLSLALLLYSKQIQRKKRKAKKTSEKSLCKTEHSPPKGGKYWLLLKCKWPRPYVMWEFQPGPIILRHFQTELVITRDNVAIHQTILKRALYGILPTKKARGQ